MPVVLCSRRPLASSRRSAPGRRSQARTPVSREPGKSTYSKRSVCHFQGEERARLRNVEDGSAGLSRVPGALNVHISTSYAWGPTPEREYPVASEGDPTIGRTGGSMPPGLLACPGRVPVFHCHGGAADSDRRPSPPFAEPDRVPVLSGGRRAFGG